jgi:DNA-binding MarR family transcriptional regulator
LETTTVAKRTADPPRLSPSDYETLAAFRHAVRRYLAYAERNARSVGLTSQQHQALLAIKAHTQKRTMAIGDLAQHLLLKHHSAVELVGRLQKAGLTKRQVDLEDRRRVLVSLTAAGEAVLASLSEGNLQELRHIAPALSGVFGQLDQLTD